MTLIESITGLNPVLAMIILTLVIVTLVLTGAVQAQGDTTWQVDVNNWSFAASWDNGEPASDVNAIINNDGTAEINQPGETCLNLLLGNLANFGGTISMTEGALNVVGDVNGLGSGTSRLEIKAPRLMAK